MSRKHDWNYRAFDLATLKRMLAAAEADFISFKNSKPRRSKIGEHWKRDRIAAIKTEIKSREY